MCVREREKGKEVKSLSQKKEKRQSLIYCFELYNALAFYPSPKQERYSSQCKNGATPVSQALI